MKRLMLVAAALLLLSAHAVAQDDAVSYVYSTYFVCSPDAESRADEIVRSSFKPHYDAAVEQGDILSWSWMQHFVGGEWRRVLLIIAPDMDSIIDASGAVGEVIEDETPEAGRAFSAICSSHEDYIWRTMPGVGNGATGERGAAGFTVYLECDMSREQRADEIVREVLAPVYDAHIGDGELTSWNWLEHHVGGPWRRILALGADDHKTLMRARDSILADFDDRRFERALRELNEICHTHSDYMWDVVFPAP
ncbi:MAG: hypothetical protein QNJ23_07855 [Woeseiaceae bacterium]|nr:hypothetical protein [Woeseiaceae bacterium]